MLCQSLNTPDLILGDIKNYSAEYNEFKQVKSIILTFIKHNYIAYLAEECTISLIQINL